MKTEAIKAFEFHKNFTKKLTTTKCVNDSYEIDENNAKPKIVKDEQ